MDRIAPSRRPEGRNAGTQRWTDLLFVHFEVDPDELRLLVPEDLSLDLLDGKAYVGLVPFRMERIAPPFFPSVLGLSFLETNLRTYVHVEGNRPGVYFLSLEAASYLAVRVARAFWGLPYWDARMSLSYVGGERDYRTTRSDNGAHLYARWKTGRDLGRARPGSADHFLLERYLLYVERDGVLHEGQVHHVPYPMTSVELQSFDETLTRAAGITVRGNAPAFVHASPGVDVEVFATRPVSQVNLGRRRGAGSTWVSQP